MADRLIALGLLIALTAAPPAFADAPQPDTTSVHEARKLMQAIGGAAQVSRVLDAMRGAVIRIIVQHGATQEKAIAATDDLLMPTMKAHIGELLESMIGIYARNYTVSDMQQLEAFYATALGEKMLKVQPLIAAQAAEAGGAWGQRIARGALESQKKALQERGITL